MSSHQKTVTVLGIETSCDECSAAVVRHTPQTEQRVLSVATHSQIALHQPFGGVVPEVASRNHLETILPIIDRALADAFASVEENQRWNEIDAIAVTNRPGLVGALLVGVTAAKSFAYSKQKPLVAVHHLEGHANSVFLDRKFDSLFKNLKLPYLLAIVSGGHSNLYCIRKFPDAWEKDILKDALVARSRDDAAGEAFDKIGKILGFPYPAGMHIDEAAKKGNAKAFSLPRAFSNKQILDFSFSGLKTAAALLIRDLEEKKLLKEKLYDVCASVQEAIVDALLSKIKLAAEKYSCESLVLVGGVAANSRLRLRLKEELNISVLTPPLQYCTDNAAMIASAGAFRFGQNTNVFLPNQDPFLKLNANAYAEY